MSRKKRLTADVSDEIHQKVKMYCAENDMTITSLIQRLIGKFLEDLKKD